jgi:hypothetical protein
MEITAYEFLQVLQENRAAEVLALKHAAAILKDVWELNPTSQDLMRSLLVDLITINEKRAILKRRDH